ncbi:hypothetical protein [Pseudomonas amygdali]|uniref:Uncharacterized protein n=2 Tax=Pseudomonas amygdali pv. lachrymans TaxID=53707 RepID=A0ABR5KR49_PSEAV|nr:hypothetical protein [Pseudomonas amygdali]AXH59872.1 hypothetical protein PLA107_032115 [Pseudomonas amygdali pv. lachrymans str. M301315]KPC17286.1 Uncharacterized protein AC499_0488 [Pseudomonas amygdali pv. lachrymans]RMT06143.1 hypothetical protein ALP54_03750 [Pseudomonas amygdali pv. lachrymans]
MKEKRARTRTSSKAKAKKLLTRMGFRAHEATHPLCETINQAQHPIEARSANVPNARTLAIMKYHDEHPEEVTRYESSAEFFKSLGI